MEKNTKTVLLKRNNDPYSTPSKENLLNGELAINTNYQSPSLFFKTFDNGNLEKEIVTVDINALKNAYSLTLDLSDTKDLQDIYDIENELHILKLAEDTNRLLTSLYPTEFDPELAEATKWYILPITIRFTDEGGVNGQMLYNAKNDCQIFFNSRSFQNPYQSDSDRLSSFMIGFQPDYGIVYDINELSLATITDLNELKSNYFEFKYKSETDESTEYTVTHIPSQSYVRTVPATFDVYVIDKNNKRYKLYKIYNNTDSSTAYRGIYATSATTMSTSHFDFRILNRNLSTISYTLSELKNSNATLQQQINDLETSVTINTNSITSLNTKTTSLQSSVNTLNTFKNKFNVVIPKYSDGTYVDITNVDNTKTMYWYDENNVRLSANKLTSRTVLRVKAKNSSMTSETVDLYPVNYYTNYTPITNGDILVSYSNVLVYRYANTEYCVGFNSGYAMFTNYNVVNTYDEPIDFTSGGNIKEILLQPNNTTFATTYKYVLALDQTAPTANTIYLDVSKLNYGESHTLYLYCRSSNLVGNIVLPIKIIYGSKEIYSFANRTDTVKIKITNIRNGMCFEIINLNDSTENSVVIV